MIMNEFNSFGEFLEAKRTEKKYSLRAMAKLLDISPQYYSEVEKNRRSAFTPEKLEKLVGILFLNEEEKDRLYVLAAQSKKTKGTAIAPDLPDYIMERDYVRSALRLAIDTDAGEEEWKVLIDELKRRKG